MTTSFFDTTTNLGWMHYLGWMHFWKSGGVDFDNDNNNNYDKNYDDADNNDDYDDNNDYNETTPIMRLQLP